MSLLEVKGLNSYYGDSHILFDVSLRVERNEVVALLGRNGAGKSTTLKSLMGVVTPRTGSVLLDGIEIAGKKSHAIAHLRQPRRRGESDPCGADGSNQMATRPRLRDVSAAEATARQPRYGPVRRRATDARDRARPCP